MRFDYLLTLIFLAIYHISPAQCYNLVWADEFAGTMIDDTKWSYQTGAGGWGNNELQHYTDRADNSYVSGGSLKIEAKSETYMGAGYTSARMRTIGRGDWRYGKMEASIKLPAGQGIWPAFWMMPTYSVHGTWPRSGEIDIMEYLGHQPSTVYGTCHYGNSGSDKGSTGDAYDIFPATYADGAFHIFRVEWEPTEIRWYVDEIHFHTFNAADVGAYVFPFSEDFHFILNMAVGGNWPGNPDGTTVFPQIMEVDYVRVYQELPDIKLRGDELVEPNQGGTRYYVPNLPGTTYAWTVPPGGMITAGNGTHGITVDWATTGGEVGVDMANACGTANKTLDVTVSGNLVPNPGFEFDFANWNPDLFNGAAASWNISTADVHSGNKAMCADVTGLGTNAWNIQISPVQVSLVNGESYSMYFWAKADTDGKEMSVAMIDPTTFDYLTGATYALSDTWALYTHDYTANATLRGSINIQFGHDLGNFCMDDFFFGRTVNLPVELTGFKGHWRGDDVELDWSTASENQFSHYEIERLTNREGHFERIGIVEGNNTSELSDYSFVDYFPAMDNYYRLKQVDLDGSYVYSEIIQLEGKKGKLKLFPTISSDLIWIEGTEGKGGIYIYNIQGRLIDVLDRNGNSGIRLDISKFQNGIYFVRLGEQVEEFIKESF